MHSNNSRSAQTQIEFWPEIDSLAIDPFAVRIINALVVWSPCEPHLLFEWTRDITYFSSKNEIWKLPKQKLSMSSAESSGSAGWVNMRNQQLVHWNGYIRIQAKRHNSNIHRHKSCWAELSTDTLPALQGTIRISRGEEIYIPAHMKKCFLPPRNNINFLLKEKPEAPLDRIWTKK